MLAPASLIKKLCVKTPSKIVLVVFDGLGGAQDSSGKTELEASTHPYLDELARTSACGLSTPVAVGITPGSGPGHLGIFGYDPLEWDIGRGILDGMGIGFPFKKGDVAARGNLATVDHAGVLVDRRAGRLPTEETAKICGELFSGLKVDGVEVFVQPVREHRVLAVFRGAGLSTALSDSDPQKEGLKPLTIEASDKSAGKAAKVVNAFLAEAQKRLAKRAQANALLLRGFSEAVRLPSFQEQYQLDPAVIAVYPMYKGLAKMAGMKELPGGKTLDDELSTLRARYAEHDFFFLHVKWSDSAGEDGDFARKAKVFEEADAKLKAAFEELKPDVIAITGDHSTPAVMAAHSWHPVPVLIRSNGCRYGGAERFTELEMGKGALGRIQALEIMPLLLAHAGKMKKYGA